MLSGEAINTNFIVFGLTQPGLEPTIYRTRDEHANHYATDVVCCNRVLWAHKTSLILPLFIEVPVPNQESEHYYIIIQLSTYDDVITLRLSTCDEVTPVIGFISPINYILRGHMPLYDLILLTVNRFIYQY